MFLHGGGPKIIIPITENLCLHWQGFFRVKNRSPTEVNSRKIFVIAGEVFLEQCKQHTISLPLNVTLNMH
jgi:hypothetical protein